MAIAKSDIRFWHELKEGSGTSVADENGGGAGTLSSSPTWTTGGKSNISNNLVSFAGTVNQQRIDTSGTIVNQLEFAFATWFYHAGSANFAHLMGSDNTTPGVPTLNVYKDTSNQLICRLNNPGTGDLWSITVTTNYMDSALHHLIFQRDSSGNIEVFVDNVSKGTATDAVNGLGAVTMNLGNAPGADGSTDWGWGGKLQQPILSKKIFDSADRAKIYNGGNGANYAAFFPSVLPKPVIVRQAVTRASFY